MLRVGELVHIGAIGGCEVIAILPLGTIEVKVIETGKYFRISGLSMQDVQGE